MNQNELLSSHQFIVKFTTSLIMVAMFSMVVLNLSRQTYFTASIAGLAFVLTLIFYIHFVKTDNFNLWANFFIAFVAVLSLIVFFTGGTEGAGVLWSFLFPFFAIQFKRYKQGLLLTAIYFALLVILFLSMLLFDLELALPTAFMFVYFFILLFQIGYLYFYDRDKTSIQLMLAENTSKYRTLLNNLDTAVIMISPDLKIIERNKTAEKWFKDSSYKDIHCYELIQRSNQPCENCPTLIAFETKESTDIIKRVHTTEGERDFKIRAMPLFNHEDEVYAVMETLNDVTEEINRTNDFIKEQKKLRTLSYVDGLTNVPNRRSFDKHLNKVFNHSKDQQTLLAMFIIDIDHFKLYNDIYGHLAGDDTLIKVASVLNQIIEKSNHFIARYGGEEFIGLIEANNMNEVTQIIESIHQAIPALKIPHKASDINDFVTVSIGVAWGTPKISDTKEGFIKLADKALYQAKNEGRNRVIYQEFRSSD